MEWSATRGAIESFSTWKKRQRAYLAVRALACFKGFLARRSISLPS
jgi:hypothetical protein